MASSSSSALDARSRRRFGGALLAACALVASLLTVQIARADPDPQALLLTFVRNERQFNRLAALDGNPGLQAQAELQATRLAIVDGALFHTGQGEFDWWLAPGRLGWIGEIVGVTGDGSETGLYRLHQAWIRSDGHREIMLDPDARLIGVGVRRNGDRWWASIVFGRF